MVDRSEKGGAGRAQAAASGSSAPWVSVSQCFV